MTQPEIKTLGALKKHGYTPKTVKDEIRDNLIKIIKEKKNPFQSVLGYEDTVIPDVERAILSRHNILFLGLRGQAKTRMAREMTHLLDEWIPVVGGSEINDDPMLPISLYARELIEEKGDETPITWLHRSSRYGEKLATPDVSVADLIGDVDPIKAANMRLSFADERVIHYGIIPRSHRGIFVINELPDLQARIQVSLFNILQEGDIQIRGFKLRMPLDILFIFTANLAKVPKPVKLRPSNTELISSGLFANQSEKKAERPNAANIHKNTLAMKVLATGRTVEPTTW